MIKPLYKGHLWTSSVLLQRYDYHVNIYIQDNLSIGTNHVLIER